MKRSTTRPLDLTELPHRESFQRLTDRLRELGRVLIAYSGGIDSTLLMKAGTMALGPDCIGVIAHSESVSDFEYEAARAVARDHGFTLRALEYSELALDDFVRNPVDRCYFCKRELFGRLKALAEKVGAKAVVEGSNADDTGDWRPGMRALDELQVVSPLREIGLTKQQIRDLGRALGLPNWGKPSDPCLASRIAYGIPIDRDKLNQVAASEQFLREQGFRQFRVRHHGDIARVEVALEEMDRLLAPEMRRTVAERLRQVGFRYITVDMNGFRSGSLNEPFAAAMAPPLVAPV